MTNNTRYDIGDKVKHEKYGEKLFKVYEIDNAGSNSPDYRLVEVDVITEEPFDVWTKASQLEKYGTSSGDVEIFVEQKPGKSYPLFYADYDEIAYSERANKEYLLQVNGEMRMLVGGRVYKRDNARALVLDYNLDDDKFERLQESGEIQVMNHSFFEIYVREIDGTWRSTDVVAQSYSQAIKEFRNEVKG